MYEMFVSSSAAGDDCRNAGSVSGTILVPAKSVVTLVNGDYGWVDEPEVNVTVTFDYNGGTGTPTSVTVPLGTTITLPTPTLAGYTFNGWFNGGTFVGNAGASYAAVSDVTLTAQWTQIIPGTGAITLAETGIYSFTWTDTFPANTFEYYIIQRMELLPNGTWSTWSNVGDKVYDIPESFAVPTAAGSYKYRVLAVSWANKTTISSNILTYNIVLLPDVAEPFDMTDVSAGGVNAFTWDNNSENGVVTHYSVQRSVLQANGTWSSWSNVGNRVYDIPESYAVPDIAPGSYKYRIVAVSWANKSTISSNILSYQILPPTDIAEAFVMADVSAVGENAFTWENNSAAGVVSYYVVQRMELQSNGTWSSWANLGNIVYDIPESFAIPDATAGSYKYRVIAMSWANKSTISSNILTFIVK